MANIFLKNYEASDELMKNMDTELLYAGIVFEQIDRERALKLADALTARARKVMNKLKIMEGTLMTLGFLKEESKIPFLDKKGRE